ncbi:TIGR02611 family protein [Dactylosporangium sp. NPDC000521]|uniref:TIGR02611 family protein n=1 Tax=Dactylosporangium sp. NPDC000521 TaxID=3363975 RepID=UPI0036B9FA6E
MRDSEADGSGVTPDSGRLDSPQGDFRRVAAPGQGGGAGSEPEADLRAVLGSGNRWRRIAGRLLGWRERLYATRIGRFGVKIVVAFTGTLVIAVGVVLLPLPGPGWLVILGGLAILAMEFHWARRLLQFTKRQLQRWTRLVREGSWLVRIVSVGGLLLIVGAAVLLSLRMLA